MKRYDEAIAAFDKVKALQPDYPNLAANRRIAEQLRDAGTPVYIRYAPVIAGICCFSLLSGDIFSTGEKPGRHRTVQRKITGKAGAGRRDNHGIFPVLTSRIGAIIRDENERDSSASLTALSRNRFLLPRVSRSFPGFPRYHSRPLSGRVQFPVPA